MRHTPDQVRQESEIRWAAIWREIGCLHHSRKSFRKLVRDLNKRTLMIVARDGGHWLEEIALLEAMRRVGPLQTHIEDFVGSPTPGLPETASAI
jgi:hypothetical protein